MSSKKIFVAGHRGMVGAALCRRLEKEPVEVLTRTRDELDLSRRDHVENYFDEARPDAVIFAAAKVGGIAANAAAPVEFLIDNIEISLNAIRAAHKAKVPRFLFLGSTCIYPRASKQPIKEAELLTGPLEPTNEAYALAKIAGLKLCDYYRRQYGNLFHSAMPTNLYGPGDNYHPENSHVLPGLLRRFHEAKKSGAKTVSLWGTGTPRREFLHVDDLADALVHLLEVAEPPSWVNVGTGVETSILELAQLVAKTVGFKGELVLDRERPDGTPVKCSDVSLLRSLGWEHSIALEDGIKSTYESFKEEAVSNRLRK